MRVIMDWSFFLVVLCCRHRPPVLERGPMSHGLPSPGIGDVHRPVSAGGAAFFDVDNTLIRGSSLYQLGLGLHARGVVSTMDILRLGRRHLGHVLGRPEQK